MKTGKRSKALDIVLLLVFCSVALLINFFHTETTVEGNQACPACQFLSSSMATQVTQVLFVPQMDLLEMVQAPQFRRYERLGSIDRSPRGPPQA